MPVYSTISCGGCDKVFTYAVNSKKLGRSQDHKAAVRKAFPLYFEKAFQVRKMNYHIPCLPPRRLCRACLKRLVQVAGAVCTFMAVEG